jgi:hypothetical protein
LRVFEEPGSEPTVVVPFERRREPRFRDGRTGGNAASRGRYQSRLYSAPLSPDVAFLCRHGIPEHVVRLASALAALRRTHPTDELFASGFDRARYWSLLAADLGLSFAENLGDADLLARSASTTADAVRLASSVLIRHSGRTILAIAPQRGELARLKARLKGNVELADRIVIAAPETIRAFLVAHRHAASRTMR